ncbi:MAG TPA: hypothetical protein VMT67_09540 [Terriglobales bacterium]|nr:hypothetical protein [Terriglobales bacterium]
MMRRSRYLHFAALAAMSLSLCLHEATAQTGLSERTFQAPKKDVEKAVKQLQTAMSGHLPTLEGFVQGAEHPLTQYQRAFYQCTIHVSETPAGSVVRVSANVTAWYKDTSAARSGYQLLKSNGRLEADLLDQLADQLGSVSAPKPAASEEKSAAANITKMPGNKVDLPVVSTPLPSSPDAGVFSSAASTAAESAQSRPFSDTKPADKKSADLRNEVSGLEDAVRNQSRPKNLVAVKKSGTPVVGTPSLTAKTLFMADAQDEFELLDYNDDWVHVRISGLSRGWIWRTSLEMPEGISDVPKSVASGAPAAADLFQVSREEMAPFPGDWAPLRGKSVKIISVQKIREDEKGGGASAKLEFAKALLDQSYDELSKSQDLAGLVLIFDSSDGGMIAATLPTIRKWKAGSLTDAAMWHQCYFDPPETFTISSAASGR